MADRVVDTGLAFEEPIASEAPRFRSERMGAMYRRMGDLAKSSFQANAGRGEIHSDPMDGGEVQTSLHEMTPWKPLE